MKQIVWLALGLSLAVAAAAVTSDRLAAQAQSANPCSLLSADEVHALAPKEEVGSGVATVVPSADFAMCRYSWGTGVGRFTLAVSVNPASRAFAGMNPDAIKQHVQGSVVADTADAAIPDVGQAAVFKSPSAAYATASAYVKDRVLQVTLDGYDAREMKGQLISLLKSAASKL